MTETKGKTLVWKVSREIPITCISSFNHHHPESKLLKPGKHYVLGRKEADLLISSRKVSREHVTFTLSEFPTSSVVSRVCFLLQVFIPMLVKGDTAFKPKARLQNPRNKPITIQRGANLITLDPSSSVDLSSGDLIHLVGGITIVFVTKKNLESRPRLSTSLLGSLGIHFVAEALQALLWTGSPAQTLVWI